VSEKKRPGRGADATGKSQRREKYVALEHSMLDCPAYRALSCPARCLLTELLRLWNGSNNGHIALGVREGGKRIGCGRTKTADYFDELRAKGFIKLSRTGTFSAQARWATEWNITACPIIGQPTATPPTREYLQWEGTDFEVPKRARPTPNLRVLLGGKK